MGRRAVVFHGSCSAIRGFNKRRVGTVIERNQRDTLGVPADDPCVFTALGPAETRTEAGTASRSTNSGKLCAPGMRGGEDGREGEKKGQKRGKDKRMTEDRSRGEEKS